MDASAVKVFLSYSHDSSAHQKRVLGLAERLRHDGIDAILDEYEPSPPEGWPRWIERQLREADFVLVVCTETYLKRIEDREEPERGQGVRFEGTLIHNEFYTNNSSNHRYLPVCFEDIPAHIPRILRGSTRYVLSSDAGYEKLRKKLLGEDAVERPPLGNSRPSPEALETALSDYKSKRMADPDIRLLDLRALARIRRGRHETELQLLDVAVTPSLCDEANEHQQHEATLWNKLRARELEPAERRRVQRQLARMERERWMYDQGLRVPVGEPISLALALHRHRGLMVIGEPGAGKSVLTRLAFLACDEGRVGVKARALLCEESWYFPDVRASVQDLRALLPVHLGLGRRGPEIAKDELSIEELIRRQFLQWKAPHELLAGLNALLEEGRIFLLCDGLDEAREEQRQPVVDQVSEFILRYPKTRFLMTSRPHGYHPRLPGVAHTRLAPLHERQQRALVWHLNREVEAHRRGPAPAAERARRRTTALLQAIGTRAEWGELSGNPLLLTLSALTPTDEEGAPRHRVFVFQAFLDTLSGKWRAVLSISRRDASQLISVWSAVATRLLMREEAHGATQEHFLHLLAEALDAQSLLNLDAEMALHLALEMGLVRELEDGTVVFWHRMFAEFLAAHGLTAQGSGAAKQLLAQTHLPVQVLRLAAARLSFISTLHSEVDELVEGLLQRDEHGPHMLLRPGLRAVSDCLIEGVRLPPALAERVWAAWADVLERTPVSPLWWDFVLLTESVRHLPMALVDRFAAIPDRGVEEVRMALARIVSPAAAQVPSARAACQRWLERSSRESVRFHGAFGLALTNEWSEVVIETMGHVGEWEEVAPGVVGKVVEQGGTSLLERLRALVQTHLASDSPPSSGKSSPSTFSSREPEEEKRLVERRLSAAFLLAVAGAWDPHVARIIALTLMARQSSFRETEARQVVRACIRDEAVQRSIFEWLRNDSTLGSRACELIREEAPLIEGLPGQVLEQAPHTPDRVREALESLLVELGEQQRALLPIFERGLEDAREEHRLCAARILSRHQPSNVRLHEALRRGMRSQEVPERIRWAYHAFGLDPSLDTAAMETLLDCARSPDAQVRHAVYERLHNVLYNLDWAFLDRWIECAKDARLSASARYDAIRFLAGTPGGEELVSHLLRPLLAAEDTQMRSKVALWLVQEGEADADCVTLAVETVARGHADRPRSLWGIKRLKLPATTVVNAILRGIPDEMPLAKPEEDLWSTLSLLLSEIAVSDRACVELLLDALARPEPVGNLAEEVLHLLALKRASARELLRERLMRRETETNPQDLLGLVWLGLRFEETAPAAVTASQKIKLETLTQWGLEKLAQLLYNARALDEASHLWRRVLEGESLEYVLLASEALVIRFPKQVGAWFAPVLERLLDSPSPSHRVDAARIALRCGLLEEKALATLLACLSQTDEEYKRDFGFLWFGRSSDAYALAAGPTGDLPLQEELGLWGLRSRVGFEAMHALCGYRPESALAHIHAWLESDDSRNFKCAVSIFAQRDREELRAALSRRLRSGPTRDIREVFSLVDEHGLYSMEMAEQFLARYTRGLPSWDDIELCLVQWMNEHPDLWALLLKQPPERRVDFGRLLEFRLPITRDAVAFAVDHLLATPDAPGRHFGLYPLENWCPQRSEGSVPTERIRGWIREVLAERSPPADLDALLLFDRIASLGHVLPEQRIEFLRRALDTDVTTLTSEEEELDRLLAVQAEAAIQIHELQGHDARILPLLERLVLTSPPLPLYPFEARRWRTLLALRPEDKELRYRFVRAVALSTSSLYLETRLELLALAGLSAAERIDVLLARLGLGPQPSFLGTLSIPPLAEDEHQRDEVLQVFVAIESLGCAPERCSALLREFLSARGLELPERSKLELVGRFAVTPLEAARLLLSVILNQEKRTQAQPLWMKRFGAEDLDSNEFKDESPWSHPHSEYLWTRLRCLDRLSQVKERPPVEAALLGLTTLPANRLLPLYRRLHTGTRSSDAEWRELLDLLTVETDDDRPTRVAKEWLTLGLWQTLEHSALGRLSS